MTNGPGLLVTGLAVVGFWMLGLGGEFVTCDGSATRWQCERRSEPGLLRMAEAVFGIDELSGPNKRTKTRIATKRGEYWAVISTENGDFRMATQPSPELADADRKAWLRWAHAPNGTFMRSGPTDRRSWLIASAVTLLGLATLLSTLWVRLRPTRR